MTAKPPIDLLTVFARFGREQRLSLRDPKAAETFAGLVEQSLTAALDNDALLHGQRTQNMFEALIISLGRYKLLKAEDTGIVHPEGKYAAADFRVILKDDSQWLIEVKNVYDADPGRQRFRVAEPYLAQLKNYAAAMKCRLMFALYWALWGQWTLIDADDLVPADGKLTIDMFKAALVSQFASLGDIMIGTTPPLKFRRIVDRSKPRTLLPSGEVALTIARAALFCGDAEITDPVEQNIAWIFMRFGDWIVSQPQAILSGDQVDAIDLVWTPRERNNAPEKFEMIGSLSSMFSRHYALQTLGEEGVIQTEAELIPDWFAPLIARDRKSTALPLWKFVIEPGRNPRKGDST